MPNLPHPHLPPPSVPATAAVTRILVLSNFSPALKTRDLQAAFAQWEADKGGFRIKWIDDVTALVVFQDANVGTSRLLFSDHGSSLTPLQQNEHTSLFFSTPLRHFPLQQSSNRTTDPMHKQSFTPSQHVNTVTQDPEVARQ